MLLALWLSPFPRLAGALKPQRTSQPRQADAVAKVQILFVFQRPKMKKVRKIFKRTKGTPKEG